MTYCRRDPSTVRKRGPVGGVQCRPVGTLRMLFLAAIACPVLAGPGGELFSRRVMESDRPEASSPPGAMTIRSRSVEIDIGKLDELRDVLLRKPAPASGAQGSDGLAVTLLLNLFDDVTYTGVVEGTGTTSGGYSLSGRIQGTALGTFDLVVNREIVFGWVITPQAIYGIRSGPGTEYHVSEIDSAISCELEDVPAERHTQ